MEITERQRKHIISACYTAIQSEESLIDAYSHVHDGSEKEPNRWAKKWVRRWKKIISELKYD